MSSVEPSTMALRFEVVDGFFRRPKKLTFVEVADVDVDAEDNVYVFARGSVPVMIFDRDGNFLDAWGEISERYFTNPHSISVASDGSVSTSDSMNHTVSRWTKSGRHLQTLGQRWQNAPPFSGIPFNRPTHFTVSSAGDHFVADGYLNAHIHCFDAEGTHKFSWGGRGSGSGQFETIHGLYVDHEDGDKVYAADRFNNRIQIFQPDGTYLAEWTDLLMPNSIHKGPDGAFYVAEGGQRVSILAGDGTVVGRLGDGAGPFKVDVIGELRLNRYRNSVVREPGAGRFCAPHGITVDSRGDVYVAEVAETSVGLDRGGRSIQKFVRL